MRRAFRFRQPVAEIGLGALGLDASPAERPPIAAEATGGDQRLLVDILPTILEG